MIISFFSRDQDGVKGTINTDGDVPSATGVGEAILEAWMETFAATDTDEAVKSLEAFYSSWSNQGAYSNVEPSGMNTELAVITNEQPVLIRSSRDDVEVRDGGEWRTAEEDDALSGERVKVGESIIKDWDAGLVTAETDLAQYQTEQEK